MYKLFIYLAYRKQLDMGLLPNTPFMGPCYGWLQRAVNWYIILKYGLVVSFHMYFKFGRPLDFFGQKQNLKIFRLLV